MVTLEAINEAMAAQKRRQSEVAALLNIDQTAVSKMLAGKRSMKLSEASKLAAWLGIAATPSTVTPAPVFAPAMWPRDVPVYGSALGGDYLDAGGERIEQTILEMTEAIDYAPRPPSFAGNRTMYALYVVGSSMEPRYEQGEVIYVDPRRPPMAGDFVVVQLRNAEDDVVTALVKRFIRRTVAVVELEQFNPAARFTVPVETIAAMHRVLRPGDMLG